MTIKNSVRIWLLASTASTAVGAPAVAQKAPTSVVASVAVDPVTEMQRTAAAQVPDNGAQVAAGIPAAEQGGVEEIVVTAQRRQENQQNVPIAITTLTAAAAQKSGVVGTETLTVAVPTLQFSRQAGNGGAPFLRGVGSTQANTGTSSPVAIYVDDVYYGAPASSLLQFNNIDQIEVLKGPQGTLFGRNATGGVINIRTKRPSHDFELDANAGYASYNTPSGNIYATGGISNTIAVNFAATAMKNIDGYGLDINTGQDIYKMTNFGVRGEMLWEPSADTSLLVTGDYSRTRTDIGLNTTIVPGTIGAGGTPYPGRYRTTNTPADYVVTKQSGLSARLDHDFGGLRFAGITAYRYAALDPLVQDNDGNAAQLLNVYITPNTKTLSQELQFLSPKDSKLQWIAGLFYYNEYATYDPFQSFTNGGTGTSSITVHTHQLLRSYAAFADANYDILPNTNLTLGIRYTSDYFKFYGYRNDITDKILLAPGSLKASSDFSKLTYRAVLNHKFTKSIMAYVSYSRGFKSGGYNLSSPVINVSGVPTLAQPVSPEVLDAYEIGLKSELFDRKVRFNAAVFRYDYSNLQVSAINATGATIAQNAARARIQGGDADINFVPNNALSFTVGLSFLPEAKYLEFATAPFYAPKAGGGNTQLVGSAAGNRTSRASKFTGSFSGTYRLQTSAGTFALTGSLYHNSGFYWEPDNNLRQPLTNLVNSTLTWTAPNGKYDISMWGKNLTNAYYYTYASTSTFKTSISPDAPRTYGFTLGVHLK